MIQTPPAFPPFPAPPGLDPNFLINQVAPLIGFVVVVVVGAMALRWLFRSPVGEALAERIREGSRRRRHWKGLGGEGMGPPAEGAEAERPVAALGERGAALDRQVAETADRVDLPQAPPSAPRERKAVAGRGRFGSAPMRTSGII